MNQENIEKNYFQSLMVGHYIDVKYSDNEWKIAKIIQRDKRYATISYDAINLKQEQVYLHSYKVAPLRTHTEGYTGSINRPSRSQIVTIKDLMNHLEIIKNTYCNQNLPNAFIITQYLRGELFVLVHGLLSKQQVKEQQAASIVTFLVGFIDFAINMAKKIIKLAPQYFQLLNANKSLYLINEKVALVNSYAQILILLNMTLKGQNIRHINLFKSKLINHTMIMNFFKDSKSQKLFQDLFNLNDGNGKWLSLATHKQLYYLFKKTSQKLNLPDYKLRDHQQVLQIYPFIIKQQQKFNTIELKYITFIINILKQQSTFEAKLKGLQQLKKIIQNQIKLYIIDNKKIFQMIQDNKVIESMINQYTFNPEIFKRFIPILSQYCKIKNLSQKNIIQLFKLANKRHQSQVNIIYQIVCSVAQFVPVDCLDSIYVEILKNNINQENIIRLVKNFTINAINNYSKEKSFLSSFFKKAKNSSKYGYYGLDLFFKQSQDDGIISKQKLTLIFEMVFDIFSNNNFQSQKFKYIQSCMLWIQKAKNYGQGIKFMDKIISTYPINTYFDESKRQIIQKLIQKHNLLIKLLDGLKILSKNNKGKVSFSQSVKWMYEFIDNYYEHFISHIKIEHIQFLWSINQNKLISEFIKKSKFQVKDKDFDKDYKKIHMNRLNIDVQQSILIKIAGRPKFYERELSIEQFQALDDLFISINIIKKKVQVSKRHFLRSLTPQMQGYEFYFEFIKKMAKSPHIEKILRLTYAKFIRLKDSNNIQLKINSWRLCLLKVVDKLKQQPQICLKSINIFFDMIQGMLIKLNVSLTSLVDICVNNDNRQKIITLPKNHTLFKLRKQIMIEFNLNGDFTMYSPHMKRDITYSEEEEFSISALPLEPRGPSIVVTNKKKQKHIHMLAIDKFRQIIEKQQNLYKILFNLDHSKINQFFWKTMDILPVNKELVKKIENCTNFTLKQWRQIFHAQTKQSIQYHLNIISNLMDKNKKWISLFYSSQGMSMMKQCLINSLEDEQLNQRTINKCLLIIIKIINAIEIIDEKQLQQIHQKICKKLQGIFSRQKVTINMNLLNNIFKFQSRLSKMFKEKHVYVQLQIMLKILVYGIFQPKTKISMQFIQTHFQHYLINHYNQKDKKIQIFEYLIGLLHFQTLKFQQNCQLFFIFIIDYMNTFIQQEQQAIQQSRYTQKISNFVYEVLESKISDSTKFKYSQILYGTFRLLIYTLNYKENSYDLKRLFKILINQFLFSNNKRIKHQSTTKILYELIKKIIFMGKELINILSQYITPQLQHNQWRKNNIQSWMIQSKRQERNVFCGLENLGATCYINCLFQQLFHIEYFRQNYISIDSKDYKPNLDQNENYQLQLIFSALKYSNKRSISIKRFCQSFITYEGLPINPMIQSDSDEFFNTLIQKLQTFLNKKNRYDIIENTLQGKLSNQLNCQGCPHKSQKQQNFHSIGVNIRGKKCLEQALQGYIQGQILDGDNAYFCQICQKKVRTQKRLCIKALPNILVIVLKRFQFNFDQMKKIKINTFMSFPYELNMKKYTAQFLAGQNIANSQQYGYQLRGTVIHSGSSQAGHYYSFVKSKDKWFSFNDEFVEEINIKRLQEEGFGGQDKNFESDFKYQKSKNAYILFYQKVKPSEQYHKSQQDIVNEYTVNLREQIITQNNNADFLSIMLDDNFVRLCQNINCLEGQQSYKFTMIYFHTVVLRDKFKEEHLPNYYRIIENLLKKQEISQWYLNQMNERFFKEFLIESPKFIRYICTSLVIEAIGAVKYIPDSFFITIINCLKTKGMSPFAKIFTKLSQNYVFTQKLVHFQYPKRVISLLLEQNYINPRIEMQSFEGYFGHENSQKDKQRQICPAFLVQSLKSFTLQIEIILKIFEKHFSRNGTKVLADKLSKIIQEQPLKQLLKSLQSKITKQGNYKKDDIEKYFFLIRYIILQDKQEENDQKYNNKRKACIQSIKNIIYQCRIYYQPMELVLKEINYIGFRNMEFCRQFKASLADKANTFDYLKSLKYWLKQAEKPHIVLKSDDYKRKLAILSIDEKSEYQLINKLRLQKRTNWILQAEKDPQQLIQSDIESEQYNKELQIRSKRFKIRYNLGMIKRIQHQQQQKWAILQRNQLDIYSSL